MKNFILVGIIVLILGFHSCITKDEYLTEEYITKEVAPLTYTGDFRVETDGWKRGKDVAGTYYFCEFEEPKLTAEILNSGVMQAFYCYTLDDNTERYALLPYEDYGENQRTEYLTVEFSIGMITFLYKRDDGNSPPTRPYDFRVRFLW
jgi:hypothetical protein